MASPNTKKLEANRARNVGPRMLKIGYTPEQSAQAKAGKAEIKKEMRKANKTEKRGSKILPRLTGRY